MGFWGVDRPKTSARKPLGANSRFTGLRTRLSMLFLVGALPGVAVTLGLIQAGRMQAVDYEHEKLLHSVKEIAERQDRLVDFGGHVARMLAVDPRAQEQDPQRCDDLMQQARLGRELQIANIALLSPEGQPLCSAVHQPGPVVNNPIALLAPALIGGAPVFGNAFLSPILHKTVLPIFAAIRAPDGQVERLVLIELDLTWLGGALTTRPLDRERVIGLADTNGNVLYRDPDGGWVGRSIQTFPAFVKAKRLGFQGIIEEKGLDGTPRILAFMLMGKSGHEPLLLWVSEPIASMMAAVPTSLSVAGSVALLALSLLWLMIWRLTDRLVVRPVAVLTDMAKRVGDGDLTARTGIDIEAGELSVLGGTFDAMAESLQRMDVTIRSNRALKALLAVRGTREESEDEAALFTAVCRSIVEAGEYKDAWVGLASEDAAHSIILVASWGDEATADVSKGATWDDEEFGRGPCAVAIRERRIVTIDDDLKANMPAPWRALVDELGVQSAIALPLYLGGRAYGALSIYATEPLAFGETEAKLLAETAADVTSKLEALRTRREHRLAQEALAANESSLANAEAIGRTGSWSIDLTRNVLVGSDELFRILGWERGKDGGTREALLNAVHPDDKPMMLRNWDEAVSAHAESEQEYRIVTPGGEVRHVHGRSKASFDASGKLVGAVGILRDVTAEISARTALAEREAIYAAIVGQARDAVVMLDPRKGKIVEFNEAAHTSLGYSRDEFAALPARELLDRMPEAELRNMIRRMMNPDGGTVETVMRRHDGSPCTVRVSAKPIQVGTDVFLAAIWIDVTEAKAAEATLQRVNREQRMLAAANRAILYAVDEREMLQTVCNAMVELGGYVMCWAGRAENNAEKAVTVIVHAGNGAKYVRDLNLSWRDDERGRGPSGTAIRQCRPVAAQNIDTETNFALWRAAALELGYRSSLTVPMLAHDGHATMCLACYSSNPMAFDDEEIRLLASLAENVAFGLTALRDAKGVRAAEAENRKLSMAVEQSPESIAITDLEAHIEYVNPAFLRQTGYTREEIIAQNPRTLQSGRTPPELYEEMWATLLRGEVWQGELINKRKDGSEYVELATLAPIRQEDGRITHYLAIKDDITDSKRMSDELAVYRQHLEELVVSRTEELAEAQRRAESANMAKSAFLANMSHEIRTPMNAIIGLTHLLEEAEPRPDQADRLRKIDRSARHLLSIVNDILDLSKVESGKLRTEHVDFTLAEVLANVADTLSDRAQEKGLQFAIETAPDLPRRLCGDSLRLSQILLNLGTNAVKFTGHGAVRLRVAHATGAHGMLRLRFEVEDSGIGLEPEQTARLFQPFEQADVSTTRKYGGTGLGLAICRGLIDLLGGEIGVNSVPGVGSTFWFELPFGRAQHDEGHVAHASLSGVMRSMRAGVSPEHVRLLLVEDDPINQEVATDLLRSRGFAVDVAENGAIALDRAAAVQYDAILMDVQMPVMDGLMATRELRKRLASANMPILAMTASVFADDKEACQEAGMDDFVAKPIQPDALIATICRWTGAVLPPRPPALPRPVTVPTGGMGDVLRAIPGLNVAAGLSVVRGDWEAYQRLLQRFCTERADAVGDLRAEVRLGSWNDARRIAHTLKGLAATMGAEPLRQAALAVETAIAGGEPDRDALQARLDTLDAELQALVSALHHALPPADVGLAEVADWPQARRALVELETLLDTDDVRALKSVRDHAAILRAALGATEADLRRAVEAFDFDRALMLLRAKVAADDRLTDNPPS